ncbi:General secretion pathway protein F [Anaerohalosphaera lusitana]|uniref:General secretion pathway protein F n=1 Tax=Anaerohalosphaera lusitana TaxID=1936003 RepID=A0A1U9NLT7_9BACT|nr:type II secretion system F family protein [Anaerohalosphaera lusitana]AQT68912.1 General secretion pathway protein F [Anaerohalosphaera lusitana]
MNPGTLAIKHATISKKAEVSPIKVKQSDLILFTTQLSVMLDSGVVLSDALEAISVQVGPGAFQDMIEDIAERIKNGECLSNALACYPRTFNAMFISMVKASEASGNMSHMLEVLSGYLSSDAQTRKQVKGAMIYPFVMLLTAVAATGSLMFFVLPRFTKIYAAKGAALPGMTQALVNFSKFMGNTTVMAATTTLIICAAIFIHYWKQTVNGQKTLDWIKVHTPIFGPMFVDLIVTRSMRILATMVNTGVSLLDSLEVMQMSCGNYYFRRLWQATDSKIRDGYQLSEAITVAPNSDLIAPGILQMLKAGEKSGKIGSVCEKVSIFYEKKLQNSIKTATALIEPVMILVMGGIIGTIAIALLLPVFRISSVMAH